MADSRKAEYTLALIDKITGPARTMGRALRSMAKAMDKAVDSLKNLQRAMDKFGSVGSMLGGFGGGGGRGRGGGRVHPINDPIRRARDAEKAFNAQAKAARKAQVFQRSAMRAQQVESMRDFRRSADIMRIRSGARRYDEQQWKLNDAFRSGPKRATWADQARQARWQAQQNAPGRLAPGQYGPKRATWADQARQAVFNKKQAFEGRVGGTMLGQAHGKVSDWFETSKLGQWNTAVGEAGARWSSFISSLSGTPLGMVAGGIGAVASALASVAQTLFNIGLQVLDVTAKAGMMVAALGAAAAVKFTTGVLGGGAFAERSALSLGMLSSDPSSGKQDLKVAVDLASELGVNVRDTVSGFVKLRAAQFSIGEATEFTKLSSDLQVITGDADTVRRALLAITQIKAKGRTQTEELLQLAEGGLSLELVFDEIAKLKKTTRENVPKLLRGGDVSSEVGLAAVRSAIMKKVHEQYAGTAAKKYSSQTVSGLWTQVGNLPDLLNMEIGQKVNLEPLKKSLGGFINAIRGMDQAGLVGFVTAMTNGFTKMLEVSVIFGHSFLGTVDNITKALDDAMSGDLRSFAADAGKGLGDFFVEAIKLGKWAADTIPQAMKAFASGFGVDWNDPMALDRLKDTFVTLAEALGRIAQATMKIGTFAGYMMPGDSSADAIYRTRVAKLHPEWSDFQVSEHMGNVQRGMIPKEDVSYFAPPPVPTSPLLSGNGTITVIVNGVDTNNGEAVGKAAAKVWSPRTRVVTRSAHGVP